MENESHCDFVKLREMLIRVNMEDMREQTHTRHYELYRRCKLEEMGFKDPGTDTQPFRYLSWVAMSSTLHLIKVCLKQKTCSGDDRFAKLLCVLSACSFL